MSLRIAPEVATPGLVSCDPHLHTLTLSGHGDATLEERLLTIAGEGIELPIATEHNRHADYAEPARKLGLARYFTAVSGNELTTKTGHFNIFPVEFGARVADATLADWPQLMESIRATPGVRIAILNHPRSIHSGFRPFDPQHFNSATGENKRGAEFSFDALELLNSGAQQTDYLLVYRDWFALLNYGHRIVGVGTSDSHDVSRFIAGQARTYIAAADEDPGNIDVAAACENLLKGRALVSMGLLADLRVEEKFGVGDLATELPEQIEVEVTVSGPSWVQASEVALYANGELIREEKLPPERADAAGEKARVRWKIPRPPHDMHLVAIATGPAVTQPFWAMTKPYQPSSPKWQGRSIGSTNPVWLDADRDRKFTAARGYAQRLFARQGADPLRLLPALRDFDEAVAAQAASLCAAAGAKLDDAAFRDALQSAAPHVQRGFAKYLAAAAPSP